MVIGSASSRELANLPSSPSRTLGREINLVTMRREDIQNLLRMAEPDLADAVVTGLSADRRFMIPSLVLAAIPQATKCRSRSNHPIPC